MMEGGAEVFSRSEEVKVALPFPLHPSFRLEGVKASAMC